jgi:spore germination protein GerM
MTAAWANTLTVLGLVALLVVVALTSPRWSRSLRRPLPAQDVEGPEAAEAAGQDEADSGEAQRTINVKLFFEAGDRPGLRLEERSVPFSNELSRQIRTVVEELIRGPKTDLLSTLQPGTKVLDVFVTARGIAYVDLSKEAGEGFVGGTDAERISVYSVVNSITANFPAVRRVQILIDDRPAPTLAGHVDLTRPLLPDLTLLAEVGSPPPAPTQASPSPSPTT